MKNEGDAELPCCLSTVYDVAIRYAQWIPKHDLDIIELT